MTVFPVTTSVLSAAALAGFVSSHYELSGPITCRIIKAGVNHSYLVAAGTEKYVLRVYCLGWRTPLDIAEELRLLDHLRRQGLPVSYALSGRSGEQVYDLQAPEGLRHAVLFSYAPGAKILNTDVATHTRIGELMARLHQATADFPLSRVTYTTQTLLDEPWTELQHFIAPDSETMQFMAGARQRLRQLIDTADTTQIRQGAVHLDIWMDNLNVADDGRITLFDFDFCGNGWLCLDLAYYIMQLYVLEPNEPHFRQKQQAFLDAYQAIVPLSAEELRLIPLLGTSLYFFYLGVQCRRFDDWSNVFISETYLKRFIEVRVKQYDDFNLLR